jgi:predicted DNA-binding transcriptional regulator AlpA
MTTEPLYMSKETLASALDCSKSTIEDMVRRRVIPAPVRMSSGCIRWRWADVDAALRAHGTPHPMPDGVRNVKTGGPL